LANLKVGAPPDILNRSGQDWGICAFSPEGLKRNGWHDVPVLAVETEGAASLHAAVQAGHSVELERIASVATSLGAKRVADQALVCVREHPVHSVLVSDRAALQACERFLNDHRVLVEPACGAALAVAYEAKALSGYQNVLVVVCGGATATLGQIQDWLKQVD